MQLKVNDPKLIEAIFNGDAPDIYFAPDVDTLIAEKDALIAELKQKLENVQASMYADVVDANMENRKLRRALWIARANHADTMQKYNIECKCDGWVHRVNKWIYVERKCQAMAEKWR